MQAPTPSRMKYSPDNLIPEVLLLGYRKGIFPMAMDDGEIAWFSPDPRGLIPLDERFHIPHGTARALRRNPFEIRIDTAFREVMLGCAERDETWIDARIVAGYGELHALGFAHSVETWQDGRLVGGLYGVSIGAAFFGESMFHRARDASKVALVHLVEHLRRRNFRLLDIQWTTPHLRTFGAYDVPREHYARLLSEALEAPSEF